MVPLVPKLLQRRGSLLENMKFLAIAVAKERITQIRFDIGGLADNIEAARRLLQAKSTNQRFQDPASRLRVTV